MGIKGVVRFCMVVVVAALAWSAAEALPLRRSTVGEICAVEINRFCPSLAEPADQRNQRICLRPYRSSLSRACRRAVARPS